MRGFEGLVRGSRTWKRENIGLWISMAIVRLAKPEENMMVSYMMPGRLFRRGGEPPKSCGVERQAHRQAI